MPADGDPTPRSRVSRRQGRLPRGDAAAAVGIGAAAAGLVVWLSFESGGFFPGSTALAILIVIAVLVVFASVARRPGAGLRPRLALGVGALALYALWQLISSSWSHAPGRAATAFDLTLLYVLITASAGLLVTTPTRVRGLVLGLGCGLLVACVAGLLTRTLPNVFPIAPGVSNERLSYPITYWNGLALMASAAIVLCAGLTGSREATAIRVASAAAIPVLAATLLFTFSRGPIATVAVGLLVMVVLAPRRQLLTAALAVLPPTAIAVAVAYHAGALAEADPTTARAVSQGHRVILVVALTALAAGLLRAAAARWLDPRLDRRRPLARRTTLAIGLGTALVAVVIALAAGAPHRIDHAYHRFVHGNSIHSVADERQRLTDPGNNGRLEHWRVAVKAFDAKPVDGTGAGTYQVWWERLRRYDFDVLNAHSLYLESLGETGWIGALLLLAGLLACFGGALARLRGPDRVLWATVAAAMGVWLVEAAVDWVWQLPAATAWFFALGGAALARPAAVEGTVRAQPPHPTLRLLAGLALLLVAVMPVRVALSQVHLSRAVHDMSAGDCRGAVDEALASASALSARAEPYELLGYCDARLGFGPLSIAMIGQAVSRDPDNWEYRYDLAMVSAAAGRDPHRALAAARRLNPLSSEVYDLGKRLAGNDPRTWKRRAAGARLLLPDR